MPITVFCFVNFRQTSHIALDFEQVDVIWDSTKIRKTQEQNHIIKSFEEIFFDYIVN